ncbi:S-adenosyl-L-methionine-dependent methyltransferase, partial [Hyaloscypha sp. PMI_1271]
MAEHASISPVATEQGHNAPTQGTHLVADESYADSAIGDDDDKQSITTSVSSSIRQYRVKNGRTYHSYKDGQYAYPNDGHHLYNLTLNGKLFLAPIKKNFRKVLDIGTGTGLWAIELANEHPSAVVTGTDLSPIHPTFLPPDVTFLVDDAKEPWVFKEKFDFIHTRQLHCAPGGWLEMQETSTPIASDDGTMTPEHAVHKWTHFMLEASKRVGQSLDNPAQYAEWMRDVGFVNVRHVVYKWPCNPWPKDKKHKTLGLRTLVNAHDGVEGFTMAMFTRVLGWQPEDVQPFFVDVRKDLKNKGIHNY